MAIAFDTSSYLNFATTSGTLAFTCTGSDRLLLVTTANEGGANDVTGVTYNGVALTEIGTAVQKGSTGRYLRLWGLLNPASGANNVVVSRTTGAADMWCLVASYTGVKQSGLPDANTTQQFTATTVTTSLTTIADNCWTILIGYGDRAQTASTGSTFRQNNTSGAYQLYDSNAAITPAGSTSMSWTQADSTASCTAMISIAPFTTVTDSNCLSMGHFA